MLSVVTQQLPYKARARVILIPHASRIQELNRVIQLSPGSFRHRSEFNSGWTGHQMSLAVLIETENWSKSSVGSKSLDWVSLTVTGDGVTRCWAWE